MFYELIRHKRDQWYASPACTVKDFIDYIVSKGEMRDAQIESISDTKKGKIPVYVPDLKNSQERLLDRAMMSRIVEEIAKINADIDLKEVRIIEMVSLDCTSADSSEWHADAEIKIDAKTSRMVINGVKTQKFWQGYIVSDEQPLRMKIRNICGDETIFVLK